MMSQFQPVGQCSVATSVRTFEFDSKGAQIATYPLADNGDKSTAKEVSVPPWFDKARFDWARSILAEYFMSIFLCHLSGLVLLVFIKSIHTTLSLSGKSRDLVCIFYRYMHTIMHVKLWYEGKVYEPKDEAYHSLLSVKQMHQNVSNVQNKNRIQEEEVALSQRDMALTQFAFVGFIVLQPEKMGFSTKSQDLERLIYFWRCIGSMLGIDDEYNLCMGDLAQVRDNFQQVFDRKFRAQLEHMNKDAREMSEQIVITANQYITFLRYRSLLKYLFEVTQVHVPIQLDWFEQFSYTALKLWMGTFMHYKIFAFFFNNLLRLAFYRLTYKSYTDSIVRCLERVHRPAGH